MLHVVERIVEIEHQFRDDPELLGDPAAQFAAQAGGFFAQLLHDVHRLDGGENADIDLGQGQVRRDLHAADGKHGAVVGGHAAQADDFGQVLLDLPRHFLLSGGFLVHHAKFRI